MAFIPIVDNPELNLNMEQLLTSTPAYAPIFNGESKQLLENDKYLKQRIDLNAENINLLKLMFSSDVTGNPFVVTFEDLDNLTVTGTWNKALRRVEF